ncbi:MULTISPECIES: DUF4351 domain-containing protein [Microcystis]|nr:MULTISPECIES: DUF4351 domain-containing protein [Microcystis]
MSSTLGQQIQELSLEQLETLGEALLDRRCLLVLR